MCFLYELITTWRSLSTGVLIRIKIADKINSLGKSKEEEKTKKVEEIYIPPEKIQQIVLSIKCSYCKKWNLKKL